MANRLAVHLTERRIGLHTVCTARTRRGRTRRIQVFFGTSRASNKREQLFN
ncbi:hypothetical protein ACIGHN_17890 [Acidovorax sp. NPDC077693]|uniref:hypothetical protein n=1 Tax=unclassified Acidovorax TaxID=2684926 RepID=UPI0037C7BD20